MAMHSIEPWIPEEYDGPVIQKINQLSAVEAVARIEPMTSDTRHVPRSGGMGMAAISKGGSYTEDATTDDEVLLTARKLGYAISFAEEDLADTAGLVDVINTKKIDWATSYAKYFDNATLGVNAAEAMGSGRPFTSVYKAVRTNDAGLGYTADASYIQAGDNLGFATFTIATDLVTTLQNHGLAVGDRVVFGAITTTTGITASTTYYVQSVPSATTFKVAATNGGAAIDLATGDGSTVSVTKLGVTYSSLSRVLGLYETSDWFDPTKTIVIAAPSYLQYVRDVKDTQGRPIFQQGAGQSADTLFGYPVRWSLGARVSTAATHIPTGNPLLIVGNRDLLIVGKRSGPETFTADAAFGPGFSTDETKMKMRARRGFAVGHPAGLAVLEAA